MLDKMITYGKTGIIKWNQINAVAPTYMAMVGLDLPPTTITRDLSAAQKQLIQIAKSVSLQCQNLAVR